MGNQYRIANAGRLERTRLIFSKALNAGIDLVIEEQISPAASKKLSRRVLGTLINRCPGLKQEDATRIVMPHARYSLTHCLNTVAAVANPFKHALGIGIDLEYGRSMDPRAARFFLTHKEQRIVDTLDTVQRQLLRLWTVKEAIYKADLNNHCNFWFFDYETQNPGALTGIATKVNCPGKKKFRYASMPYQDGFLTIAIAI
ncbi:MAG: 4'-phosphopantetheinyl transferase superfamily protein [Burkholderiales bacterium]|nr:4'-phosphopantetheinyl transferase superfamily protein [Burkholderiales bacterium]MDR4517399.1 4'-phosphopantetheinyl transferase superfamily protein [Nitrosomonas sp.]